MPDEPTSSDPQSTPSPPQDAPQARETPVDAPAQPEPSTGPAKPAQAPQEPPKETDWKAMARQWEDRAKTNKTAADERDAYKLQFDAVAAALGLSEQPDDPARVAELALAERDATQAELKALRLERAAATAARRHGADVDALLDSRACAASLAKLDPAADEFASRLDDAVTAALEQNSRLKAAQPAQRSVTDTTGSADTQGQLSRADLARMTPDQIEEARVKGRLTALLRGTAG